MWVVVEWGKGVGQGVARIVTQAAIVEWQGIPRICWSRTVSWTGFRAAACWWARGGWGQCRWTSGKTDTWAGFHDILSEVRLRADWVDDTGVDGSVRANSAVGTCGQWSCRLPPCVFEDFWHSMLSLHNRFFFRHLLLCFYQTLLCRNTQKKHIRLRSKALTTFFRHCYYVWVHLLSLSRIHPKYIIIHYCKITLQSVLTELGKIMGSSPHYWLLATGDLLLHST